MVVDWRWVGKFDFIAICLAAHPAIVLLVPVEALIDTMERNGWATVAGCLDATDSRNLRLECVAAWEKGDFRKAGVGKGTGREVREEIRRDQVMWLEPGALPIGQRGYLDLLETLRLAMNRRFFLGLFDFEGHFAIYPEGAFYKPHLDRHSGTNDRVVTVILYLNPDWSPGDGGELKLWTTAGDRENDFILIAPRMGTLVCFMAADFWHEVLPARKPRISITGWFRQR